MNTEIPKELNEVPTAVASSDGFGAAVDKAYAAGMEAGRNAERQECWDAINKRIRCGHLPGNGCDETAQNNGVILAANLIMERISPNKKVSDADH